MIPPVPPPRRELPALPVSEEYDPVACAAEHAKVSRLYAKLAERHVRNAEQITERAAKLNTVTLTLLVALVALQVMRFAVYLVETLR